jgi:poly(hydroxyalkanoate) depolymerase family esterase
MRVKRTLVNLFAVALLLLLPVAARAGSWASGTVKNNFGTRSYKLWIPAAYTGKNARPLVLMLHGCTQTADDFAAGTQFNALADRDNFLVVYAEQTAEANPLKCWNWYDAAQQTRGQGEPSLLAEVVNQIRAGYKVDARRIYVAGVSAGGAMAVILGATYPDIFAAIGVHSGLAYKSATNLSEARPAMSGASADAVRLGQLAFQAMGKLKHPMPVIVFQGAKDGAVAPANADQVITQWAQANDYVDDGKDNDSVDDKADATTGGVSPGGYAYRRDVYNARKGKPLMEKWIVQELKHAWSGGAGGATYTDPKGPNASQEMWRFFQQARLYSGLQMSATKK